MPLVSFLELGVSTDSETERAAGQAAGGTVSKSRVLLLMVTVEILEEC